MNLSHIIHEFSFGPFFPAIAQPLDMTYVKTEESESRFPFTHITSHLVMQSEFQCFSIQFKLEIEIANIAIDDDDDMTLIRPAQNSRSFNTF
jgi:hypothetical protein